MLNFGVEVSIAVLARLVSDMEAFGRKMARLGVSHYISGKEHIASATSTLVGLTVASFGVVPPFTEDLKAIAAQLGQSSRKEVVSWLCTKLSRRLVELSAASRTT